MGDYNLLPHQEVLLRQIVEGYRNKTCNQTFLVIDHGELSDIIEEHCRIELTPDQRKTLSSDFKQIANEGLLEISGIGKYGNVTYQITKKTLDAVDSSFVMPISLTGVAAKLVMATLDFSFVSSVEHRQIIERDYEEVQKCLTIGAHKAAIVLCGSIVEALLLERLSKDESKARNSASKFDIKHKSSALDEWELYELVKIASDLGILDSDSDALASQLRGYRNVIHPGLEIRKGFEPSPAKADAANSLLKLIVEKFSSLTARSI